MEELHLQANGVRFFARASGPADGPLVLLFHGFPELSLSWRRQLPALGAAGLRAVAPDLRGYGRSGGRDGPFDLRTLADDAAGLVAALGRGRAALVGHDWGGGVAWAAATYRPEVVERVAALNCPHPAAMVRELVRNPRQLLRSGYMLFFQIPWLPERLIARGGGREVGRALRGGAHVRSAFTWEETAPYREALSDPAAARAALGYYRAALRGAPSVVRDALERPVSAPALVIWGARDRFLLPGTVAPERMAPFFAGRRAPPVRRIEEAGHFVQNEAPEEVNRLLLEFLLPDSRATAAPPL